MAMMMHGHGFLLGQKIGMHARIIATSAIYQKVGRKGGVSHIPLFILHMFNAHTVYSLQLVKFSTQSNSVMID